jgi:AAA family ATP:ADP antiporter
MARKQVGIPPELRRDVAVSFLAFLGLLAGHSMLETARDALFLAKVPASRLPLVYIAIAVAAFTVARLNQRALDRFAPRRLLFVTLIVAAFVTAGFWFVVGRGGIYGLYALYVWTGVVATLAVSQLWVLFAEQFNVSEAKRAFAVIGAGGLVGATLGAAGAGLLVRVAAPRHMVLVAAMILAVTSFVPLMLRHKQREKERRRRKVAPGGSSGLAHPYMRRLLFLVAASAVTVTVADLVFKTVIVESVPKEDLGSFFAMFYATLNGLSLIVQLFLASWLLRVLGVNRALWVLPILFAASAVGFVATLAVAPILLMKVFDGSLRHSLNKTATELLFLPLPSKLRSRHKVVVDAIGSRGGQALASLAVLGAFAVGAELRHLVIGLIGLSVLWLVAVYGIKHHYVQLFRDQLRAGTIDTRVDVAELDLHSLEALIGALSSPDERLVISSLELLEESGRARLIPALILYHPSGEVVIRALSILAAAGRTDFHPLAGTLMHSIDPAIRAAALRTIAVGSADAEQLRQALDDSSASVRATAMVGLMARGWATPAEIEVAHERLTIPRMSEKLGEVARDDARVAFVSAVRLQPSPVFDSLLLELDASDDVNLRAAVAETMAVQPNPEFLPPLIGMLANSDTRLQARAAILALGDEALPQLDSAMDDDSMPRRVRLHLPRTISKFADDQAAEILLRRLADELDTNVGYKILRGLGRLIAENPALAVDRKKLDAHIEAMMRRTILALDWRVAVERAIEEDKAYETVGSDLILGFFREKEVELLERVFRLLGMRYPHEDFQVLHAGLLSESDKTRANSLELLENVVSKRLSDGINGLLFAGSDAQKLVATRAFYQPPDIAYVDRLRRMLRDHNEAVSSLAAHHIAELGIGELESELEAVDIEGRGVLGEVIEQALALLGTKPEVSPAG